MKKRLVIITVVVFLIDLISKIIISSSIKLNESIIVINNFFNLTYVRNTGAAFSFLTNHVVLLIIISFISLFLFYKYYGEFQKSLRNDFAFGLTIGGLLGNLFDRICFGYVKDFLDFNIFGYNYPVFNLSDCALFIGVLLIIYAIIKGEDYGISSRKKSKNR